MNVFYIYDWRYRLTPVGLYNGGCCVYLELVGEHTVALDGVRGGFSEFVVGDFTRLVARQYHRHAQNGTEPRTQTIQLCDKG